VGGCLWWWWFDWADFHITSKMICDLRIQGDPGFSGSEEVEKMP
jgi:hypothetical protein